MKTAAALLLLVIAQISVACGSGGKDQRGMKTREVTVVAPVKLDGDKFEVLADAKSQVEFQGMKLERDEEDDRLIDFCSFDLLRGTYEIQDLNVGVFRLLNTEASENLNTELSSKVEFNAEGTVVKITRLCAVKTVETK